MVTKQILHITQVIVYLLFLPIALGATTVTLNTPSDASSGLSSPITLTSTITDETEVWNATIYTNKTGGWSPLETRWNGEIPYNDSSLVFLYHFNNESGFGENDTNIYDWTGHGITGTVIADSPIVPGKLGTAVFFNGSAGGIDNRGISCGGTNAATAITGDITLSAWVKVASGNVDSTTHLGYIIGRGNYDDGEPTRNNIYSYGIVDDNDVFYFHESGTGTNHVATWRTNLVMGVWYNLVLARNTSSKTLHLYVNGVEFGSAAFYTTDANDGSANDCSIGNRGDFNDAARDNALWGTVDEAAMWNKTLSAAEISALYNYTKTSFMPVFQDVSLPTSRTYLWNVLGYDNTSTSAWAASNHTFTVGTLTGEPTLNTTEVWTYYYGNVSATRVLGDNENQSIISWNITSYLDAHIYITDKEANVNWNLLYGLGTYVNNTFIDDDFAEFDTAIDLTNYTNSTNRTYLYENGSRKKTGNWTIYSRLVHSISLINVTENSSFNLGILWDASDDKGNNQYDLTDHEDIVYVSEIKNNDICTYGICDYEIKIPYRFSYYNQTNNNTVYLYVEID